MKYSFVSFLKALLKSTISTTRLSNFLQSSLQILDIISTYLGDQVLL